MVLILIGTHLLTLFPQGFYQSKSLLDDENASKEPVFNPEAVIAHCFKQFKQEDFHLPRSRRRVIILPQEAAPRPVCPTPQPQTPSEPTPSPTGPNMGKVVPSTTWNGSEIWRPLKTMEVIRGDRKLDEE